MNTGDQLTDGFLGDEPAKAMDKLQQVLTEHVFPFVNDWWAPQGPIPSGAERLQLVEQIKARAVYNPLPDPYTDVPELLQKLSVTLRWNSNNFNNIHPNSFLPATLAAFLVSIQNPNNMSPEASEGTSAMETEAINWMGQHLFGLSPEHGAWGTIVSGGTVANMTALVVARDHAYQKLNRIHSHSVGGAGLYGQKPGVVIGTTATHYSIKKSLWLLGMGSDNLITVPVAADELVKAQAGQTDQFIDGIQDPFWKERILYAIDIDRKTRGHELQAFYDGQHEPFSMQPLNAELLRQVYVCQQSNTPIIGCVLTLGTTDTGTLEKLDDEVINLLKSQDIYLHCDAATGGFSLALDSIRSQTNDLSMMNSFTVDAHKMGMVHYACGAVLFRDNGFKEQLKQEVPYVNKLFPTLEGSRAGTGSASLWMATRTIDVPGYQSLLTRLLAFTHSLRAAFVNSSFQVLHHVQLNFIVVAPTLEEGETRERVNRLVEDIRSEILAQGEFMINLDKGLAGIKVRNVPADEQSDLVDVYALRIVVSNPFVELSVATVLVNQLEEALQKARYAAQALSSR